ncbi:MAG: DNA polymerase I [Lachnospiraceae bacterium]|nr:DNA polymerase I [Lachnospiraceae bacterium]
MADKLLLVDGHSILSRSFYGIKSDMTNSEGLHTNAIYGFLNTFLNVFNEEKPNYVFVAFDVKEKTFRHKMYEAYKGQRKPFPEEFREQVPVMKDLLKTMGVTCVELPGFEADDIIGTLSKRAEKEGLQVTILSGDRDLLQLATDNIMVRIPKGASVIENYHTAEVIAKLGVSPLEYIDVKALMGDTSDNIPGVPGIGEKTATNLIVQYKSLENVIEHVDDIKQNKIRENLKENIELARLCKKLATINIEAPLTQKTQDGAFGNFFNPDVYKFFSKLELKRFLTKYKNEFEASSDACDTKAREDDDNKIIQDLLASFNTKNIVKKSDLDAFTFNALMMQKIGIAFCEEPYFVAFLNENKELNIVCENEEIKKSDIDDTVIKVLNSNAEKSVNNLKKLLKITNADSLDVVNRESVYDVGIAAYLLNPLKSSYNKDDLARDYLDMLLSPEDSELALEAYIYLQSKDILLNKLEESQMKDLYLNIEMPLVYILHDMEKSGIRVDADALKEYGDNLSVSIDKLKGEILDEMGADDSFNLNSPKQLGEFLFERMQIPGGKKTKTGYSTSADVLEKLAPDYPFIAKILEYRTLTKLKSTYADGLAAFIKEDGRIHGTFNQTITATGRISSTEPNLQNIPIRMEIGRQLRKIFIPKAGFVFIDADYSQIELRVLAHISGDENLIEAYKSDQDIHKITASKVFGIPLDEVTKEQRSNAKAVNFGIVYGISSFGLSNDIGISRKEAKEYIESYFKTYPGIKSFLDDVVDKAKKDGFVRTMYNRIRPIPELKSSNHMQKMFGERVAMNSPIQGTAADIIKIAMIHVDERLRKNNYKSRLILQVHDELLIEAAKNEAEEVKQLVIEEMQKAADLKVKLEVEANIADNWLDAH